jgi:hypothetical protein
MSVVIRGGGFINLIKGHLLIPQPQPQVVTTSTTTTTTTADSTTTSTTTTTTTETPTTTSTTTTTTTSYCTLWQNDTGDDWYGVYTLCDGTQPGGLIGAGQQRCMRTENPPVPSPSYGNLTPLGPCSDPTTTSTTTTTTTSGLFYAASRFSFNNTGANAICFVPTSPAYYIPDPLNLFGPPLFIYQDAAGTIPFSNSHVNDNLFGLPSNVYSYNSSTGEVGSQTGTCL